MDNNMDLGINFAGDFNAEKDLEDGGQTNVIHIRVQQRVGRKMITIIEGISEDFDEKKILRAWKKTLNCNGAIQEEKDGSLVIQLTGDQRNPIAKFLVEEGITKKEYIKIHGA